MILHVISRFLHNYTRDYFYNKLSKHNAFIRFSTKHTIF